MKSRTAVARGLALAMLVFLLPLLAPALESADDIPSKVDVQGMDPAKVGEINAFVKRMMVEKKSPGLGVGIVDGYTLVYAGYFGWQDMEAGVEVSPETFFRIGSISKSITAIGLMQQWQQGKFKLDDNINDYMEDDLFFPPHPIERPATFHHLLTHTSGAGEFLSLRQLLLPGFGVMVEGDDYKPLADYLEIGFHNKVDPGVKYAYSNYGYALLGFLLENIADQPFNDYMRENVFLPLGMEETTYKHTDEMESRIATGYSYNWKKGEYKATKHQAFGITPSGNVYSTVQEFGLYVAALVNKGANRNASVIEPETLEMMMDKQHSFDERQMSYGYAFRAYGDDIWGSRVVGHTGSVPFGYTSIMLTMPERRVGVYVFANSGERVPTDTGWGALKLYVGGENEPPPEAAPDRSVWPELEGLYGPEFRDFKTSTRIYMSGAGRYRVEERDGGLYLIKTWQGGDSAELLHSASETDPYYFWYGDLDANAYGPNYLSFQEEDGKTYLVLGGVSRFMKLGPGRELKAAMILPLGRAVAKINPF